MWFIWIFPVVGAGLLVLLFGVYVLFATAGHSNHGVQPGVPSAHQH